jgi:hypothetical protein
MIFVAQAIACRRLRACRFKQWPAAAPAVCKQRPNGIDRHQKHYHYVRTAKVLWRGTLQAFADSITPKPFVITMLESLQLKIS